MKIPKNNRKNRLGFSLIELLIAMTVFMIVGGAAVSLLHQHTPLFSKQQNQATLNTSMRNALAQLQIDAVNAGSDFTGSAIPLPPLGVIIAAPPAGSTCFDPKTQTYGAGCFDTLYIVTLDPNTPPGHPDNTGDDMNNSTLFALPADGSDLGTYAGDFHAGDGILVIGTDQNGATQVADACLSKDGTVSGNKVHLAHNPQGQCISGTDDPLNLDLIGGQAQVNGQAQNKLGFQFDSNAWIIKLNPPIIYGVDVTNPADPQLYRQDSNGRTVIADQVIGFKVGAALSEAPLPAPPGTTSLCPVTPYYFLSDGNFVCPAQDGTTKMDFTQIRSLMISVISRTTPNENSPPNTFDGGSYRVESNSVVIYPRNLAQNN